MTARIALAVILSGLLVAHARILSFVCDDAYISFRYAENLVRHGSLVYNLGERVEGYTNFGWTMLMAAVIRAGGDPVAWSQGLGIGFGVLTLACVARFTARRRGTWTLEDAVAPLLLVASPSFAAWCTGGLETAMFTCFATLAWTSAIRESRTGGKPWSAVVFAAAALVRPEGLVYFAVTGLDRGWRWIRHRDVPARAILAWCAIFAALFVPYFAWRWWYYGWPLPNTYYAKAGMAGAMSLGLRAVGAWITDHVLLVGAACGAFWPRSQHRSTHRLLVLWIAATIALVVRSGGDFMALHRFFVPILPALAVLAADGLCRLPRRVRRAVAVGFGVGLLAHGIAIDRATLRPQTVNGIESIGLLRRYSTQWTAIGRWLAANVPPGTRIATSAAGAIPYTSRLYTLDILGLNDAWVAHHAPAYGDVAGHVRFAPWTYVAGQDIDLVIMHPAISEREEAPRPDLDRFWVERGYAWRSVRVPGLVPPIWGFWQRTAP